MSIPRIIDLRAKVINFIKASNGSKRNKNLVFGIDKTDNQHSIYVTKMKCIAYCQVITRRKKPTITKRGLCSI